MNEQNETNETAPAWMTTQAPKTETTPPASGEAKKARKPRRTKAQMLADAAARPDAEKIVGIADAGPTPAMVDVNFSRMAAEDHRDAVVRDVDRIVPTAREEHAAYLASRLPIIAIVVALLSLATSLVAIVK